MPIKYHLNASRCVRRQIRYQQAFHIQQRHTSHFRIIEHTVRCQHTREDMMLKERTMTEEQTQIIERTETFVRATLEKESTGHDWWHILRVRNNALNIARHESDPGDLFIIQLGALLHDIAEAAWQAGQLLPSWQQQAERLAAVLAE